MALYKRGNVWWMSFQVGYQHIQKTTKCRNKVEAAIVERAYRTQLAKGEVGIDEKPEVPHFSNAIETYLTWARIEHRAKPNTVRSYESTSRALLKFFGDKPIDLIKPVDVERFKEWRSKQSTKPRSEKKARRKEDSEWKPTVLRPATINRELALLKIIFNFYIRRGVVVINPVSRVKFFAEDNGQMRVVSIEEERLYLEAASQPLRDFAIVMIETGMRPAEVARIERKNVNLESEYVFVPFGKTKAAKRKIPLTMRAAEVLGERLAKADGDYPFASDSTSKPLTTLKGAHAGALRRSKLTPFRLYDLRHTFATRFIESGGDIVTLQALLGHSNIQMVTRYAHPTDSHKFEAMRKMEAKRAECESKSNTAQ